MEYDEATVLEFPRGLPAFEQERRFIVIEQPHTRPLVYLQSLTTPSVCFAALPAQVVDSEYRLELSDEDAHVIGLDCATPVPPGMAVLCLALVSIRETAVTANLMAPIVVSLATRRAVQAISASGRYSHQHALDAMEAVPA